MRRTILCAFLSAFVLFPMLTFATDPLPRSDCFWGIHFDLHPNQHDTSLGADIEEDNIRDFLQRVQPDYVQYDCKGHAGYLGYPSTVSRSAKMKKDSLKHWRKITSEEGIGLFIHFSGVWDSLAVQEHPEWAAIKADGSKNGNATSVFSSYVDERMLPQLKEATDNYSLDGVWVDGECWSASLDYSPAALKAWEEETGYTTAPKGAGEPHWQEWKAFHRKHFRRYLSHWVDRLHEHNPAIQITSNWMYTTFAPIPADINLDFISGDYTHNQSLHQVRLDARYLAHTQKPWDLMAWGFTKGQDQSWTIKPAVQLMQEGGVVMMQGGGYQIYNHTTRTGYLYEPLIAMLEEVGTFVRARREFCHKSVSVPQVALLLSTETFLDRSNQVYAPWSGEYNETKGALDALIELNYSVDVLAEHQLTPCIDHYPFVVVPYAYKLNPDFKQVLIEYVKNGGSLLVMGTETVNGFQDHLGVEFTGQPNEAGGAELNSSIGTAHVGGSWQSVQPTTATAIGYRYPSRDTRKDGTIAATVNQLGNGKIAAIYGPVASHFYKGHQPQLRQFLGDISAQLFPAPAVKVTPSSSLELSLRHTASDKLSLHLLNTSNAPTGDRFSFTDSIPALGPIEVELAVEQKPRKVTLQPHNQKVKWTWRKGIVRAILPRIEIYDILVVE